MDCRQLTQHLAGLHDRHFHYLDAEGQACRRAYADFARDVTTLRARVTEAGIAPGERVGIHAANSVDWLLWDLALIDLGCIVVALPDDIVRQHGAQVFERFGLRLIALGKTSQSAKLEASAGTLPIDAWRTAAIEPRAADASSLGDDACALAFSSGTAGVPKCLVVNRRGIEWDTAHYFPQFAPGPRDRILLFLPFTHQQQRLLAYAAFSLGTSIVLTRPEQLFDALRLLQPTLCLAPPLFYEGIHERFLGRVEAMAPWQRALLGRVRALLPRLPRACRKPLQRALFAPIHRALGGRLRIAVTGMAPIRRATLDFFGEIGVALHEAYGLTETGVIASNVPGANRPGTVGRLVPGCRVQLAPDGEVLVAREANACLGYFEPGAGVSPFVIRGLVPTGDIGAFDADGYLTLRGRKKEIIITAQGHKIHPEVVEARLNASPVIVRSVVFGDARKHLSALVVVRDDPAQQASEAVHAHVAHVNETLGDTARIGETVLTNVPFTLQNGLLNGSLKVNRRAVAERFFPAWFASTPDVTHVSDAPDLPGPRGAHAAGEPPCDPDPRLFAMVKDAWEFALDMRPIDPHANFFEIGGDSLCAMRIITRLQGKIDTALDPSVLFLEPTIHAIASKLTRERLDAAQSRELAVDATAYEEGSL
ncbi:AMP-binding protein [Paraburkholderia bannensis]|uniref:AMP-binding protein n=1 Tax=Paraburkholderia bannensis TaxID=765414 RepID=UPI002AB0616A|nr:AMP-binding protein [Paraburkholderia bannensis]